MKKTILTALLTLLATPALANGGFVESEGGGFFMDNDTLAVFNCGQAGGKVEVKDGKYDVGQGETAEIHNGVVVNPGDLPLLQERMRANAHTIGCK